MPTLYTLDLETDPFEYGVEVKPFAACIYDGETAYKTWGPDCVEKLMGIMEDLPPGIVYAHNGGRFDFFWFLKYADKKKDMVIIKNRIVKFMLSTGHDMRDSFKLFPFALAKFQKTVIDYDLFKPATRELHRESILSYLVDDCRNLYQLVLAYFEQFGESLTIGTTAFKLLKERYDVGPELGSAWDKHIRDNYYFGGRVERYKLGVFQGSFSIYDINSAYPFVMRDYLHPIGMPHFGTRITEKTFFLRVQGQNFGAFPLRTKAGLRFDIRRGTFCVTIHEFNEAVFSGKFKLEKVIQTLDFDRSTKFSEYVDEYYGMRLDAGARGDEIHKLMFKFLLNNSYGKFSINPLNYKDYCVVDDTEVLPWCDCNLRKCTCGKWRPILIVPDQRVIMYAKPSSEVRRMNIATGASITGATRSLLLKGLTHATRPMYCDTDSIIAESIDGIPMDNKRLGAWKLEGTGDKLAIAGRKMYALFNGGECLKYASKGVNLTPQQIQLVADGELVTYNQAAPVFRLDGSTDFISRDVRSV